MKQIIKNILISAVFISLIIGATKVNAVQKGIVNSDNVRIRKQASIDSEVLTLVEQNEEIDIISEEDEWYKVEYSNNTGYIRKDMISIKNDEDNKETDKQENKNQEETNQESETQENQGEQSQEEQNQQENQENENKQKLQIGFIGKIKNEKIDLKIVPSINSTEIVSINKDTEFKIIDIINKWANIKAGDQSGWILINKIIIEEENSTQTTENEEKKEEQNVEDEKKEQTEVENNQKNEKTEIKKYVSVDILNMRSSADKNGNIISELKLNTQVTVIEEVNSTWSKINYKGKTGYVASKYLANQKIVVTSRGEEKERNSNTTTQNKTTTVTQDTSNTEENNASNEKSSNSTGVSSTGSAVVDYAKQYIGYRYVYGGASPSTGFDCSGFTTYVFKHFGISLGRSSSAQASNGVAVSKSNLKAGDILIFNNSSNTSVGHVGIYIGGNKFVHAANSTKGVIISSLSESYYSSRFVGARRVIN